MCDSRTEVYSRIVGYYRPVQTWNRGKQAEYANRRTFKVDRLLTKADSMVKLNINMGARNVAHENHPYQGA